MPELSNKDKFLRGTKGTSVPAPPVVPKLPQELRKRFPELKEAFDKYDADWEAFVKQGRVSGSTT